MKVATRMKRAQMKRARDGKDATSRGVLLREGHAKQLFPLATFEPAWVEHLKHLLKKTMKKQNSL